MTPNLCSRACSITPSQLSDLNRKLSPCFLSHNRDCIGKIIKCSINVDFFIALQYVIQVNDNDIIPKKYHGKE